MKTVDELLEVYDRTIRQCWFVDHIATRFDDHVVDWRKPETAIYSVRYRIDRGCVVVTGDVEPAIYQSPGFESFDAVSKTAFGYFLEKCVASSVGRELVDWDAEIGFARVAEMTDEEVVTRHMRRELLNALASESAWHDWLSTRGIDIWGDVASFARIGRVPSIHAYGHWLGLRLAMQQLSLEAVSAWAI